MSHPGVIALVVWASLMLGAAVAYASVNSGPVGMVAWLFAGVGFSLVAALAIHGILTSLQWVDTSAEAARANGGSTALYIGPVVTSFVVVASWLKRAQREVSKQIREAVERDDRR